jgi:hypothetical protein
MRTRIEGIVTRLRIGFLLGAAVLPASVGPAPAQPAAPPANPVAPAPPPSATPEGKPFPAPQSTPFFRVVPVGEMRTLAFLTSLFPDCSPQGPVVLRLTQKPAHGTVTFEETSSFPRYGANTPLSACNAKRAPGMRLNFEAAEGYEGLDAFKVLIIYPDGTATELDGRVSIR